VGMDGAAIPVQLRVGFATKPRGGGGGEPRASIAPGALSAWHGGPVDFSPGDLSGAFCCFSFANIAMP